MNDRFRFRAGFTVSFYDIAGNDIERQIILDSCFLIDSGGDGICVNEEIIQEALDIYVAKDEHKFVWDLLTQNYAETDGYYFIDSVDFLEQCTGLKDRNGRLIYEGDIVKLLVARNRGWIPKGTIAPVEWGDFACCGFILGDNSGNLTEKCAKNCEVIGNIHENKELLNN